MGVDYGVIAGAQPSINGEPARNWQRTGRRDPAYYPDNNLIDSIPVTQIIGGIVGAAIFAFIAKKRPEFITQFISIPVGAATGAMIGKVLSRR